MIRGILRLPDQNDLHQPVRQADSVPHPQVEAADAPCVRHHAVEEVPLLLPAVVPDLHVDRTDGGNAFQPFEHVGRPAETLLQSLRRGVGRLRERPERRDVHVGPAAEHAHVGGNRSGGNDLLRRLEGFARNPPAHGEIVRRPRRKIADLRFPVQRNHRGNRLVERTVPARADHGVIVLPDAPHRFLRVVLVLGHMDRHLVPALFKAVDHVDQHGGHGGFRGHGIDDKQQFFHILLFSYLASAYPASSPILVMARLL